MPRAGGQSTATGVSFQGLAIARAIVDVYQGQADFVRPEAPPLADFGQAGMVRVDVDDYIIQRTGARVYHQAKSNAPGGGSWTLNKLWREEILQTFMKQLAADPGSECCLVTPSDCPLLGEVANRARAAVSIGEFAANLTPEHRRLVDDVRPKLSMDEAGIYGLLRLCRLEIRTSEQLRQDLNSLASLLFADPIAAADCLHALAMRAMEVGQSLDRTTIDTYFSERSVFAKPKATEAELLAAVRNASSRLRTVVKDIAGVHIQRPTVDELLEWVSKPDLTNTSVAALLDQAGSGKTVAMSVLLSRLEDAGFVVLGIKADGLTFSSQDKLASLLELPDSIPSILQCLQAAGRRIALLVDQVDALSSAMSRESSGITVVLDLVARAAGLRIPIVLACRSFDWKYDHRLRHLQEGHPAEFTLPELTDGQLTEVLSVCSLNPADLHPLTMKVVRCPLRLKILVEVIQARRQAEPSWAPGSAVYTLQTLYQDFWMLKTSKAQSDGVAVPECETVAVTLARSMHDSEQLSAPEATVADHRGVRDWLISEGILGLHGKALSFFHQTFFDFVFARWFVASNQSLVEHLVASDQGLFYRPMVRQILEYLRDVVPRRYVMELKGILEDPRIRRHLHWLAIAWLGQHHDPRPEERDLLEPLLTRDDTRRRVLGSFRTNAMWFDLLTAQRFDRWLRTLPETEVWPIVWHLSSVILERQTEVASLLWPHVGKNEGWNDQIASCLAHLRDGWDGCSADLLCDVLRCPLTNLELGHGWWAAALEYMAKSLPARGCEAVGIILSRFAERWATSDEENTGSGEPKLHDGGHRLPPAHDFAEALGILANAAPAKFLKETLPWTLAAMQTSCYSYSDLAFKGNWRYWRYERPGLDDPSGKLLTAIATAARNLAKTDPALLRELVPQLLESQCRPMQVIVAEAYSESPSEFAADAAAFLSSDPRRLRLGSGLNSVWHSRQLIAACCPHWSDEEFRRVQKAILAMKPYPTESVNQLRWRGVTHLELLQALDRKRLGPEGSDQLGQLERKFPRFQPSPPQAYQDVCVGPPIRQESINRMDDNGWLGAMKRYTSGRSRRARPHGQSGGRLELSRSLRAAAKEQPQRFFRLAMDRMEASFHADYVEAIISGIAEAGAPVEDVELLVRKFLPHLEKDHIRPIAWAIDKYAEKDVPEYLIDLLKHWVEHAADPVVNDDGAESDGQVQIGQQGLLTAGMNTDRGAALWALAAIQLKSDPPRRGEYLGIAAKVMGGSSRAVRAVYIQFLQYAIPADPTRACELFQRFVGKDLSLLRERGAYDFIYHSLHRHATEVLWAIVVMLADTHSSEAREAGAKLACLAAFDCPAAAPLRDACVKGDVPLRKGAAAVYSTNVVEALVGKECRERLSAFMNDEDGEVRKEATVFLRKLDAAGLSGIPDFLRAWSRTKSLDEGADSAAYMLERFPVVDPELTLDLSERSIDVLGRDITNVQSRHGTISLCLTRAILNVYHRSLYARTRSRAIDLFEKLEELGCAEVHSAMEAADRL